MTQLIFVFAWVAMWVFGVVLGIGLAYLILALIHLVTDLDRR